MSDEQNVVDGRRNGVGWKSRQQVESAAWSLPVGHSDAGVSVTVSPGVVRLKGATRPVPKNRGKQSITEWSRQSRANMVRVVASLDMTVLDSLPGFPAMVTLTLPGSWAVVAPDASTFKGYFEEWRRRYRHTYGTPFRGLWKLEFQRRGAPHLHLYMVVPSGDFRTWCSQTWADIVNHPDPVERAKHARAGTRVDVMKGARASDPRRLAVYFGKHSAPGGESDKEYQHKVPELWVNSGGPGRFWGYIGLEKVSATVELSTEDFITIKRYMRKAQQASRGVTIPVDKRDTRKPLVDTGTRKIPYRKQVERMKMSKCGVIEVTPGVYIGTTLRAPYLYHRWVTRYRPSAAFRGRGSGGFLVVNDAPKMVAAMARGLSQ